jgi:hypothetical protein
LKTDEDAPVATTQEHTTARLVQRKKKQTKGKRDKSERMQKIRGKKTSRKNIQEKKRYERNWKSFWQSTGMTKM